MGELQPGAVVGNLDITNVSPVPQGTASEDASAARVGEGTETRDPSRPRSGFARQKIKIARLTNDLEVLQAEYWRLQDSHGKLEQDYCALEAAFNEITTLNASLSAELRQAKHRPSPGFSNLMMGMTRG
jgi:hypothetical protein